MKERREKLKGKIKRIALVSFYIVFLTAVGFGLNGTFAVFNTLARTPPGEAAAADSWDLLQVSGEFDEEAWLNSGSSGLKIENLSQGSLWVYFKISGSLAEAVQHINPVLIEAGKSYELPLVPVLDEQNELGLLGWRNSEKTFSGSIKAMVLNNFSSYDVGTVTIDSSKLYQRIINVKSGFGSCTEEDEVDAQVREIKSVKDLVQLIKEKIALTRERDELVQEKQELVDINDELSREKADLEDKVEGLKKENSSLFTNLKGAKDKISQLKKKLNILEEDLRDSEEKPAGNDGSDDSGEAAQPRDETEDGSDEPGDTAGETTDPEQSGENMQTGDENINDENGENESGETGEDAGVEDNQPGENYDTDSSKASAEPANETDSETGDESISDTENKIEATSDDDVNADSNDE